MILSNPMGYSHYKGILVRLNMALTKKFNGKKLALVLGASAIMGAARGAAPDSLYTLNFDDWPSEKQIKEYVDKRDYIKIVEDNSEPNAANFSRLVAFFSPVTGNITINDDFILTGGIDLGALQHELRHKYNSENISLFGMTFDQIVDIHIHDEFSATIAELMFRRKIYMNTKSISKAFQGVEDFSLRSDENDIGEFSEYKKFLRKNKETLTDIIMPAEADLMIDMAIRGLVKHGGQYAINIPNLVGYKLRRIWAVYKGIDTDPKQTLDNFTNSIRKIYTFDGVCILDICSEAGRAKIESTRTAFLSRDDFKNNIFGLRGGYREPLDEYANKYQQTAFLLQKEATL